MAALNRIQLIGNTGGDPRIHTFDDGGKQATVSLAVNESWKDRRTGEPVQHTEWFNLVFRGQLAALVEQYVKSGHSLFVEGRSRTRPYTKDDREHWRTEIHVTSMQFLGKKQNDGTANPLPEGDQMYGDSDVPF